MSIADNIRKIRNDADLTQEEFGEIAGVSAMAVSQWENGRAVPRMGAVQRIADHFGVSKGAVIDEGGSSSFKSIPVYSSGEATVPLVTLGRVHAGPMTDEEEVEQRVEVPASILASHPKARAALVEGDCMNRVVPEGLAVVYDPDLEPTDNKIAIVEDENYRAVMRRWRKGRNTVMLVADSYEDYDDIILTEDSGPIRLVGTVVWVQSVEDMG